MYETNVLVGVGVLVLVGVGVGVDVFVGVGVGVILPFITTLMYTGIPKFHSVDADWIITAFPVPAVRPGN